MHKTISFFLATIFIALPFFSLQAMTLGQRLGGRILLQVEQHGEAWYISPENQNRHFLGRPADAFEVMRNLGLGISNADFKRFENNMPDKLLGKILLKVEDSGKAFYINPLDRKAYSLGRPAEAFAVMRNLGLGVTDLNLNEIAESVTSQERRQNQERKEEEEKEEDMTEEKQETNDSTATSSEENADQTATSTQDTSTSTEETEVVLSGSESCEFTADYYRKETISGAPNYSEKVMGIDFDWGTGAPELLGDFKDRFSVRFIGNCYFEEGEYEFSTSFNDGIEATIDDYWITNSWKNRNFSESDTTTLNLDEGTYRVKVDYYEHLGEASVSLDWTKK